MTHDSSADGRDGVHLPPEIEFAPNADHPEGACLILRTTTAIRERAAALLARARRGESSWFSIGGPETLDAVARQVAQLTRQRFGDKPVPYHSRWRHFEAGGVDRLAQLDAKLGRLGARERARVHIDLAIISVLLDAGAGPDWHYYESATETRFERSEGLAVASFHAFCSGLFSSDPARPMQADAKGLRALVGDHLAAALQVSEANPLVGLAGRATLLRRLGESIEEQPEIFGDQGRPGGLFDMLVGPYGPAVPPTAEVTAHEILTLLLDSLSRIFPSGQSLNDVDGGLGTAGVPSLSPPAFGLGDCWRHSAVEGPGLTRGWMPFHKLTQWLAYSLIEPIERAGVKVRQLDALTGLPEYRNGDLLLDSGVIVPRDAGLLEREWQVGDEFIVEWRALTVALLDELRPAVARTLKRDPDHFPLACLLEGGTWAAGRALAQRLREGRPALRIRSDGTVF